MIRKEQDGIVWLEFELLSHFKNLQHGVVLRHGGYSHGPYGSLNLGYNIQNPQENERVKLNRDKIKKTFHLELLIDCNLEHRDKIINVSPQNISVRPTGDALFTIHPHLALFITHADCQAAIFYDPIQKALANVHAGWRGNVHNIYRSTVEFMKNKYGSRVDNIHVCISPSLGPHDAEFLNYQNELPPSFWEYQIKPYYFDLWGISKDQLLQAGILEHHIQIAGISTLSNPEDYFSYRREKVSGRHGTFAVMH
ncbi:MAG: hypothetical protein BGO14_08655 [Chlamydiales bacterium 38-26]|nr:laccase domain-containing protein [Chlamydiales bacterium]OJV11058.1 MAG: hypothetical protein BGO14_08655 [Chlamydiales bacterium 38-26]